MGVCSIGMAMSHIFVRELAHALTLEEFSMLADDIASMHTLDEVQERCARICSEEEDSAQATVVKQVLALQLPADYTVSDEAVVADFIIEFGQHPIWFKGAASIFWDRFKPAYLEWESTYVELWERFKLEDIKRIPYTLKYGYSAKVGSMGWVPVPDYGVPLVESKA